ncbi:hypothetical protein JTE90_005534 [Oedothorax gibbosus]|uniref:Uncharacterized protein n=1 Tax=Oedothorax gibbosus TaxID=931172 RepID=A0AAV6VBC8_9ARAC|nr:hypothetical protein JTE90_005534 [Oedothorax gibbosus]
MEDNSSASSDSDNALLSSNSNARIDSINAGTQTPEMPRHEIKVPATSQTTLSPNMGNKEDSSITVYKLDTQKPFEELEQQARTLAIPDVVVEYIKDSFRQEDGQINPAFETQELIVVRTPSSVSLRDDANKSEGLLPMAKGNPMYYSLPRHGNNAADMPRMLSVVNPSLTASSSSLGYPRSVPPSPNFGYRPLESESSAVYTIISPVRYVGNEKEMELRLLAQLQAQMEQEKATSRKFEFCPSPPEVETKRRRLQCATDICSVMFLIPGVLIAIITPIALIPMFILPLKYFIPLIAIFVVSGITAVLSLAVSGFVGNIVWHYDDQKQRMRPKLHCGRGPLRHFWGNGFFPNFQILREEKETANQKVV